MSEDNLYSQQHMMSPMSSRGKVMQGPHGQNMHPGMSAPGQQGMPMSNQGPGMPGMSPGHQIIQGGPGQSMGPGASNPVMAQNMPIGGHSQNSMGGGMGGLGPQGMQINSSMSPSTIGGMPNSMPGMPDNSMGNMQSGSGGMQMQGHAQQQANIGPGQIQNHGMDRSVQGMPPSMPGGSPSPNLSGSQMAGGAMGPPNQSVDPSTSQSKYW